MLNYKLVVFDLDGTLTPSKQPIEKETVHLLKKLLKKCHVAVVSGAQFTQFNKQFISYMRLYPQWAVKMLLFPANATEFYVSNEWKWRRVYTHALTEDEKEKIYDELFDALKNFTTPERAYGQIIEDRGSQVTYSALGQKAHVALKEDWHLTSDYRPQLAATLREKLPEFDVYLGGLTSVDIVRKGQDKSNAIVECMKQLTITESDILYIGDALFEGGNDYVVKQKTQVECFPVKNEDETRQKIKELLAL